MISFSEWKRSTIEYSKSPLGSINTQLIITFFISFGCLLGSFQNHLGGGKGYFSFILFAFGVLQLYMFYLLLNQKKQIKQTIIMMKEIQKTQGEM
jgi:hypothetical protein